MQKYSKTIVVTVLLGVLLISVTSAIEFNQSFKLSSYYIVGSHAKPDQYYINYLLTNTRHKIWGRFTRVSSVYLYGQYYSSVEGWYYNGLDNINGGIMDEVEFMKPELQRIGGQCWSVDHMDFILKLKRMTPPPQEGIVRVSYVFVMYYEFLGIPCKYIEVLKTK